MVKLKFETATPLHISNGNELSYNIEYIIRDYELCKLNVHKASYAIAKAGLFDFSKNYSYKDFTSVIEDNKSVFDDDSFDYSVYADKLFLKKIENERAVGRKTVLEFVNSNGKFYIPGSSIKGALLTILRREMLGIDASNGSIEQKFVITDSQPINEDNFVVDTTLDRPPSVSLLTLNPGVSFDVQMRKLGELKIDVLRNKLKGYSLNQIEKAKGYVKKYTARAGRKPNGADQYLNILEKLSIAVLEDDEYLINLGYGGGSWFKIFEDVPPPKFDRPRKKGSSVREWEAHTTFAVNLDNSPYQLGWCKLKIEE